MESILYYTVFTRVLLHNAVNDFQGSCFWADRRISTNCPALLSRKKRPRLVKGCSLAQCQTLISGRPVGKHHLSEARCHHRLNLSTTCSSNVPQHFLSQQLLETLKLTSGLSVCFSSRSLSKSEGMFLRGTENCNQHHKHIYIYSEYTYAV